LLVEHFSLKSDPYLYGPIVAVGLSAFISALSVTVTASKGWPSNHTVSHSVLTLVVRSNGFYTDAQDVALVRQELGQVLRGLPCLFVANRPLRLSSIYSLCR
jgi:hypothetical protein